MQPKKELLAQLKSKDIAFDIISKGAASAVIVPAKGAKIAFAGIDEENFFWSNEAALLSGTNDIGGQRSWVAPEGGPKGSMFSPDWKTWRAEPAFEPGRYFTMKTAPDSAWYRNEFDFSSNDGTRFILALDRKIAVRESKRFQGLGVNGLLIKFRHTLINRGSSIIKNEIGLWSLIQVSAEKRGVVLVPLKNHSGKPYRDNYFENVPADRLKISSGSYPVLSMAVLGGMRYKIGISPNLSRGIIAGVFPSRMGDELCLIVKKFRTWPSRPYVDKPGVEQDSNGDAIQSYNSLTSGSDGFFELECHSPSAVIRPSGTLSHDIDILCYKGPKEKIIEVCKRIVSPGVAQKIEGLE